MWIRFSLGNAVTRWPFGPGATPSSFLHSFQRAAIPCAFHQMVTDSPYFFPRV